MMKKKMGSIMLSLFMLFFAVMPVHASEFNEDILNSVVLVYEDIVLDGEWLGYGMGTGFFVGEEGKDPEYFVTNYHVIEIFVEVGGGTSDSTLLVLFDQNNAEEAYVVDYNKEKDLAILRLVKPTSQRKPLKLEMPGAVGSQVFAVGFPAVADDVVQSTSVYSVDDATVTGGNISRLLAESGTGRRVIQTDASIQGGNSGGPLVNDKGNVIGVNTFILADQNGVKVEGINYAVSVEELIPLLNRNNVTYVLTGGEEPEPEPVNVVMIGGIAFGLAVVLILVVLGVKSKKSKSVAAAEALQHPAQPQQSVQIQGQPLQQSMQSHMQAQIPSKPHSRAELCSLSPQHRGMKVVVDGRQILIGRDSASCQIIFREGTPGVSRIHCSVSWNGEKEEFVLTDMKSSYGTFLWNGQRLTPGMPYYLKPGEHFYLGDRENEIRTERG